MKPRIKAPGKEFEEMLLLMRLWGLNTVCEEAACPNISECWGKKHVTTMILGDTCTRSCAFCNIKTGKPEPVDFDEPARIAKAVKHLNLNHVVVTSVDRDDLPDGGANHFAMTVKAIREETDGKTTIEILTPDFLRKAGAAEIIIDARPDVFNHNLETVPRLYRKVRPGARYFNSLSLLAKIKQADPSIFTKSGLMVGLGEDPDEILQVMDDMRVADVDFLTIGQYLQPTPKHYPLAEYVSNETFEFYRSHAKAKGFKMVSASPLTRSSYHADEDFEKLKQSIKISKRD